MFCDNLKEYLKQKGYSQTQLGDRIGVTRQAISRWESGADTPSLERIAALARVLGVTIDALAGMPATLAPDDSVRVDRFAHMIDVPVLSREVAERHKARVRHKIAAWNCLIIDYTTC